MGDVDVRRVTATAPGWPERVARAQGKTAASKCKCKLWSNANARQMGDEGCSQTAGCLNTHGKRPGRKVSPKAKAGKGLARQGGRRQGARQMMKGKASMLCKGMSARVKDRCWNGTITMGWMVSGMGMVGTMGGGKDGMRCMMTADDDGATMSGQARDSTTASARAGRMTANVRAMRVGRR